MWNVVQFVAVDVKRVHLVIQCYVVGRYLLEALTIPVDCKACSLERNMFDLL